MEIIDLNTECRICYEKVDNIKSYCNCKGTQGYVHQECLLKWFDVNVDKVKFRLELTKKCELCNENIRIVIYKDYSFYITLFSFMILFFGSILFIFKNKKFENREADTSFYFGIVILIFGICYYTILILILNYCYKNKVLFST
tara:strand:- start:991 stop:1419 length:429 start_codon:yes stop_codon:yes gene_type:complete